MRVAPANIVMASLPETQDDGKYNSVLQYVFHAPPEESSLHTSDSQPNSLARHHRTVDWMAEFDEQTMGCVNFGGYDEGTWTMKVGTDSELGSSEVVGEHSRRTDGAAASQIHYCELNNVLVLERERSLKDGLGGLTLEIKFSEQNVTVNKELSMGVTNEGNVSAKKSLGSGENLGTQVVQPAIAKSGGNFSFHDGDVEKCVVNDESCELPRTEVNEISTSERQNRTDEQPGECAPPSIFNVLNVLEGDPEPKEDRFANVSLVKIAKIPGMTFPSPRWRR